MIILIPEKLDRTGIGNASGVRETDQINPREDNFNMRSHSYLRQVSLAVMLLGIIFGIASTAQAQYGRHDDDYCPPGPGYGGYQNSRDIGFFNGYQLGYGQGANDRADYRSFDIDRSKAYRDADSGYRSQYGSRNNYKDSFRQGFQVGYRDGYYGNRRRTDRYGYTDSGPVYERRYPNYPPRHRGRGRGHYRDYDYRY
ncbi:MAG: hypothetical protein AB1489_12205 [Acidobacteriota bacterium]